METTPKTKKEVESLLAKMPVRDKKKVFESLQRI